MADNTKVEVLFGNAATADVYLALRLDKDLYDTDTLALVGGTLANTGNKPKIPINKRYAIASGLVQEKKFIVERGTGIAKKKRSVPMLVRKDLADTIDTAATTTTKNLRLGRGATAVTWKIVNVI
jgi:hypothetical protein